MVAKLLCLHVTQGCKFSDFSLISDLFTWTPVKITFEISSTEHVLYAFLIDSDFQEKYLYYFRLFDRT